MSADSLLAEMLGEWIEHRVSFMTDGYVLVGIYLNEQNLITMEFKAPTHDVDFEEWVDWACTVTALQVIARLQAVQAATAALKIAQLRAAHGPAHRPGDDMHESWYDNAFVAVASPESDEALETDEEAAAQAA